MLLDFDPSVTGIASQPFWLRWHDQDGTRVSHAPDFFARRVDGSAVVLDCRPVDRRKPADVAKFDVAGQPLGSALVSLARACPSLRRTAEPVARGPSAVCRPG
jgi:hypothetical protein